MALCYAVRAVPSVTGALVPTVIGSLHTLLGQLRASTEREPKPDERALQVSLRARVCVWVTVGDGG